MQQCVYQIAFRNVYEFKKQLAKSGWVWSRTLSTLLSMHEEIISLPAFAQCADISSNFTAGSWKRKQLDEMSTIVSKIWTKYVFAHYLDEVIILTCYCITQSVCSKRNVLFGILTNSHLHYSCFWCWISTLGLIHSFCAILPCLRCSASDLYT